MKRLLMIAALSLASSPASAEDLVLTGGRVVTVSGKVIEGGTVIIRGDKIAAVGKELRAPAGARVISCEGKWITPGLIETHSQLGLLEISAIPETVDFAPSIPDPIRAAARMDDAVNMRSSLIAVARRQGLTSAIVSPLGGLISGRSAWIDLVDEGSPEWKRAVSGPIAMHVVLGEPGASAVGQSRALAALRLREVLEDTRLYKRQQSAFERNALRKLMTSHLDLAALVPVVEGRMKTVIEVRRASDILQALKMAREEGLSVILVGAEEGWLVADEIAAAKVPVILNPMANLPTRFDVVQSRADNAALLAKKGVRVVISTDTSHNAGNLRFHAGNAVRAGLDPEVALRATTLSAAEAFGLEARYGSIDTGKIANVVVWTGDPFEPSSWAEAVVIRGVVQPTETRQTKLRDRYKTRVLGR